MKKVLVTGGCGFIGSHLVDLLVSKKDYEIYVIDNLDTGRVENINKSKNVKYFFKDIRNILTEVELLSELEGLEVIYHLGARARIQPSFTNPTLTIDVNTGGTSVICELARKLNAKVVYAGSSSYYGGVYLNPYSFTKWQGEEVCKMYSEVYRLKTAIARFFNVYGERHPKEGPYGTVVGIFERQYSNNEALTVTGDGEQRRDFTSVHDIVSGLYAMSTGEHYGAVYNLGTGKNLSINELADMFGSDKKYIPARPGEARHTLADISKTQSELGWQPEHNIESYINNWLKNNE